MRPGRADLSAVFAVVDEEERYARIGRVALDQIGQRARDAGARAAPALGVEERAVDVERRHDRGRIGDFPQVRDGAVEIAGHHFCARGLHYRRRLASSRSTATRGRQLTATGARLDWLGQGRQALREQAEPADSSLQPRSVDLRPNPSLDPRRFRL